MPRAVTTDDPTMRTSYSFDHLTGSPRILVIGDLMVDRYLWGTCRRISPEAPVPVISVQRETFRPGGAGNVLANLAQLGARVQVGSVSGKSARLMGLLRDSGVDPSGVLIDGDRPVTEKTRLMTSHQQVVRYDTETCREITPHQEELLLAHLDAALPDLDAVVLSDYGKGVITSRLARQSIDACRRAGVPILVDPKGHDYARYAGATVIAPNRAEASQASKIDIDDDVSLRRAGSLLLAEYEVGACLVTLGEDGMALFRRDRFERLPTRAREVFDVTGAGDTVIAALAFALGQGIEFVEACRFANVAAGLVVGRVGAATTTVSEICAAARPQTVALRPKEVDVETLLRHLSADDGTVAFTNGCFDILHAGHVSYLQAAAHHADVLVVGLNSDASVRRLKGATRPLNPEGDRALVVAGLQCVDYVVIFTEDTPIKLIESIRPDVLLKGGDYEPDAIVGAALVRSYGGRVMTVPLLPGHSTTRLVDALRDRR